MSNERPVRLPDDSGGIRFILMPKENQNRASTSSARHRTIGSPSKRSSKSAMASSAKTLSDLLRPAKRLRPVSPSPQTLSPKSSVSTLCMSPLTGDDPGPSLISGHRKRRDADRSLSRSKCNLRICSERIENSRAQGVDYVKLQELLVDETWLEALTGELQKPYAKNLCRFVEWEMRGGVPIYPPPHLIFNALHSTPFDQVKAVIIGQDPYHGPGQAMGLAFSVPEGIKVPSSLMNIYKELKHDIGCSLPSHGNLERWAVQGVLLLNAVLTVRKNQANSHAKKGWEPFTDAVIQMISQKKTGVVFLLWGNFAKQKSRLIDESKHHILTAAHPSGLSANRGFFGCRHFSQTNQILERLGLSPIDWQL